MGATAPVEFESEESDGDRRLAVGVAAVVRARPVEVVPVDRVLVRGDADLRGHACTPRAQEREEEPDEREVPEVVRAPLQFETVGRRPAFRRGHDAGVVHEDVDRPAVLGQRLSELADRGEGGQIERVELDGGFSGGAVRRCVPQFHEDLLADPPALLCVAHGHDDLRAGGLPGTGPGRVRERG
ncbi:hypothetical protein GCM10009755_10540 [Brevibacterium samyangense]|uniref:Uncharacterized protein n=1 Tax=Brevibacterium samyangense TaxID=366888 RepID=A0ABN2TAI7_9MICO